MPALSAGQFVDFAIGDRDNNILRDNTGFSAVTNQAGALMLSGGALLGLLRRRGKPLDAA